MTAVVADLDIERMVHIDRQIDANESTALRARWEFGHQMLAMRNGKGRLRDGLLSDLANATGKSRAELKRRALFATRYPTEDELAHAVSQFPSWHQVVANLKAEKDAEDNLPIQPPAAPEGEFSTFVADPPWQYGNTSTRGAAGNHYGTMTIDELCELDHVREHSAKQAHLYLWTTAGHLPDAFRVMEAWGFEYKTYLVWVKPQMGMGNYFRISTELALFGIRGGLRTLDRGLMNWFQIPRGKHSQKPAQFHDLVMKASPPRYMELFSRCYADAGIVCVCSKCRLGWEVWGNQS